MSPEEYQRIKEAEKAHLRKLKELKGTLRSLERQGTVREAIEDLTSTPRHLLDRNAELVDRLALEAAQSEARLEMALEAAEEGGSADAEDLEEQWQEERAHALLRQIRSELREEEAAPPAEGERASEPPNAAPPDLPEKTIGRVRRP